MSGTNPKLLSLGIGAALLVAAPALVLAIGGGDEGTEPAHDDHDAAAHAHARERPAWGAAEGRVPSGPQGLTEVWSVEIEGMSGLDDLLAEGLVAGSGTLDDPYVIEGLHVRDVLEIKDTDAFFVIRENFVAGELRLNWNADKVHVHHNYVNDLRVNENIPRSGDATGGLIEANKIGVVGQIRHYDGIFRANTVGPAPKGPFRDVMDDTGKLVPWFADRRVVNIDGFDGAIFEGNAIVGVVEMQLHGHHHASCFACHSHNHGDSAKASAHDHSVRYHEAVFRGNEITVEEGLAFRYTDEGHAGDDRTARSEPEESLEGDHVHFTDILIEANTLVGGPLVVDVFNADDRYHHAENPGTFTIRGNSVSYAVPDRTASLRWFDDTGSGIAIRGAKEVTFLVEDNTVALRDAKQASPLAALPFVAEWLAPPPSAGVSLDGVDAAQVTIARNAIAGPTYGVAARWLGEETTWAVRENRFTDVDEEVHADESVANPPER